MRHKTVSISSDSLSEDDLPLKVLKRNGCTKDRNAYDTLQEHSIEACEFCDRISKNRYSSLIHNVSHIIIPLLNQTIIQCSTCLHSFANNTDYNIHRLKKHPELVTEVNCDRVRSENVEDCFNNKNSIPRQQNHIDRPNDTRPSKSENSRMKPIKNRLIFEEDSDDYEGVIIIGSKKILNDLTTECKVNIEICEPLMIGDEVKSVHYNELMKPGVYRCKKCGKGFPVRYDAIIHESSHIRFKNSQITQCIICKNYLVGGKEELRQHYITLHETKPDKEIRHSPKIIFEDSNFDDKPIYDTKILSLCQMCYSFCRNNSTTTYECIKVLSGAEKKFECDQCNQSFVEIKVVRRRAKRRAAYGSLSQKKKKKTNEQRLKTIAHRFKMMKN